MREKEKDDGGTGLTADAGVSVSESHQLPHDDTCASHTCRWCDTDSRTHDALRPDCEFDASLCDCVVDYQRARDLTPSGFAVEDWLLETRQQFAEMKATLTALLAELRRCDDAGERIDMQSDLIVRAYDHIGVVLVTQRDVDEMRRSAAP